MADQQVKTLDDAMAAADEEVQSAPVQEGEEPDTQEPERKWEAPGWAKQWKADNAKALEALATNPDTESYYKAIVDQVDPMYSYIGRRDQELAGYKKRYDPVGDVLAQAEHSFTMQGQSLQQGLGQLLAVSQSLASNPDQTLPWLGQLYKPRNPAQVIQALSQAWGADLGQLAQEAPYIDPQVQGLIAPLMNRLHQMEQSQFQSQQSHQMAEQQSLLNSITAFENAVDESGNPKHPYFREVANDMIMLAQMGRARNVDEAYALATRFHPGAQEAQAKQAETAALQAAARTTAASKQATSASRNVNSSARGNREGDETLTLDEAMARADKTLGYA